MAKTGNKATRKMAKKGLLDFTSRVGNKKGKATTAGKSIKGVSFQRDGAARSRGGKHGKVRRPQPKAGRHGGRPEDKAEIEGDDAGKVASQNDEYRGIEEMDVDAFMKSGMFGGEGEESADEEADLGEDAEDCEDEHDEQEEDETEDIAGEDDGAEDGDEVEEDYGDEEEQLLESEVQAHKAELERLKAKDPEFFRFLEKNDGNLLSFGKDEDGEEDDEEEEEEEEDEEEEEEEEEEDLDEGEEAPSPAREGGAQELTLALLKAIEHSAFEQHSLKALRRLVLAFKAASHMADESSRQAPGEQAFSIASSSVFDRLLVTCLTRLPDAFGHHLFQNPQYSALDPAPFAKLQGLPAFRSLRPALYRSLKALHYLLGQITEPSLLAFTLSRLERFLPFLVLFPRLAKFYLRTLLSLWAASEALDVKLVAFLRVRQAATVLPFPFLEHCLKGAYLAYARNAKFVSEASLPGLTLMGNGLVELYGLDLTSAYQHAFVYVRQLALHLRAAYTKKTPEALQKVQCWQYLNCCKVWVAVLTAHVAPDPGSDKAPSQLRELVFPLAQILLGAVRLTPSARLYPLTLHCLTLLQRLAARAQVFIPCAAPCLSMLEDPALSKKPKPSTEAPPSLALALKLPGKAGLEAKNVQEALVDGCMDVLSQEILVYRYALAFPEYAYPIKDRLRRFAKTTRNARWRALARGLVEECEKRGRYVERERARKEMAPTDAASLEALRPRGEVKGENKEDLDAAGRLKAFLDAKAAREGVGVEVLEVGVKKGSSGQLHGKEETGEKRGREKKKGEAAESKTGRGANGKKEGKRGQQRQEEWEKIPIERMEDEVGALHEWSEEERESTGGDAEEEGEEEDDEDDEDKDEEDGDMEDGEEEEDDEGDEGDDGSSE